MAALVLAAVPAVAQPKLDGLALADRLGAQDRAEVARAVADIEAAPNDTPYLDEALREAARACEDVLADPARALAIYERISRDFPDGSPSRVARVRSQMLRDRIGANNAFADEAKELAELVTNADTLDAAQLIGRAEALANLDWPGAPDAALFLAEWDQRTGRLADAARRYDAIAARWPNTPQALSARRGAGTTAVARHDWSRAEAIAKALPAEDDADRVLRDELFLRIDRGRRFDFWYRVAWFLLAASVLALGASFAEAARRGGWKRPPLAPPVEVMFLAPVGVVLVGAALTTHNAIAPAVIALTVGGLLLAWISGIALELLRVHGRRVGRRAAIHAALCFFAVVALCYIVLAHNDLLEMLIETVRFGPDP